MNHETYETSDIVQILNINRNTFQVWLKEKWIRASIHEASRKGDKNIFNYVDLAAIKLFKVLSDEGFLREEAAKIIKLLYLPGKEKETEDIISKFFTYSKEYQFFLLIIRKYKDFCTTDGVHHNLHLKIEIIYKDDKSYDFNQILKPYEKELSVQPYEVIILNLKEILKEIREKI